MMLKTQTMFRLFEFFFFFFLKKGQAMAAGEKDVII